MYDREGDTTFLSFCNFDLFELIFLFIYQWFTNGLKNQGAFRILPWIAFETVKNQKEEKWKAWVRDNSSNFKIFETFGYFEIDFIINLNNCFWIMINSFGVFLLKP